MDGNIYIVTDKKVEIPLIDELKEYKIIQTGNHTAKRLGYQTTTEGDNLAQDNEFYAELTVYYWLWKNVKQQYIGINHYRRFLYYQKHIIREEEIEKLLKQYDILVPNKRCCGITVQEQWNRHHRPQDLVLASEIIESLYPEYMKSFWYIMNSKEGFYTCNIFISRKSAFNKYCEWIFPILFEMRKRINLSEIRITSRKRKVGAFLSERLFNVWLYHNQLSTINLEMKVFPREYFDVSDDR